MSSATPERRRAAALALFIALVIVAVLVWRKPAPSVALAPPPTPAPSASPSRETRSTPAAQQAPAPVPPIIDAIVVEKDEVCEGEENLVTVKAHTPDGNDAFLHYQVGSTRGSQVALRSYLDDRGRPSAHRVSVFGRNNVVTGAAVPSYRVKRCDAPPAVVIEHRLLPNTVADFEFQAHIVATGAMGADAGTPPSIRPRNFRWAFGDGARADGNEPRAVHSFASRPQDTLYSQFLVTVDVLAEDGRVLRGRHAIELLNPAFEALAYKGVVLLFADLVPRFPVLSPNGVIEQGVRLWHTRHGAVTVTKIVKTARRVGNESSSISHPSPGSVLGAAVIPPGPGIELHVQLDTRAEPETFSHDYALEGRTDDGFPVRGAFSVMRPPVLPSKERHQPISDPLLVTKVKIAREVLHRDYVTDEDIWSLERSGRFESLRIDAGPSSAPQP